MVAAFGAERVFWGSDLSRLPCPYAEWIAFFTEEMSGLSSEEVTSIMGRGLSQWLGWA